MKQYEINACLSLGMTPRQIADALGVSISYVYRIRARSRAWRQRFVDLLLK